MFSLDIFLPPSSCQTQDTQTLGWGTLPRRGNSQRLTGLHWKESTVICSVFMFGTDGA
jgi:hypothetical protein